MSGLFGGIDASEIPDDPFYVAPDTYLCILVEAQTASSRDGSRHGLTFKWKINDPDSEFNEMTISDWNTYYPNGTDGVDATAVRRYLSNLKKRLLSMGVSEEDMSSPEFLDNLDELLGLEAYVTVIETKDRNDPSKKYTNIKDIRLDN